MHEAIINDAETYKTENKVKDRVVIMGNTLLSTALTELLFTKIESDKREEEHQDCFNGRRVVFIFYADGIFGKLDDPDDSVNTTGYNGENDTFDNVSFFDFHRQNSFRFSNILSACLFIVNIILKILRNTNR